MTGTVGADIGELRSLAALLVDGAESLESSLRALSWRVQDRSIWRGPDADRFRAQWDNSDAARIRSVVTELRVAASVLVSNADEQERTSNVVGIAATPDISPVAMCTAVTTADLYHRVRHNADPDNDGVSIEAVVGSDGRTRYVVYLDGTGGAGPGQEWSLTDRLSWWANAGKMNGIVDESLFRRLDDIPAGADVMLVGYSQGGLDAQTLAASGRLNVTDVVTFGSPQVLNLAPANLGTNVLHLEAVGDPVPLSTPLTLAPGDLGTSVSNWLAPLGGGRVGDVQTFTSTADTGAVRFDVHSDEDTYRSIGDQYDMSGDERFEAIRRSMSRYQGTRSLHD